MTPTSMTYWLRDPETITDLDVRTPVRTVGPFAGERMFAELGLGLQEDWAQLYPGTLDDPGTPDIVEGFGRAVNFGGDLAEPRFDRHGNEVGPFLFGSSVDFWRIFAGDDQVDTLPGYEIRDWWIDNYCAKLTAPVDACYGDLDGDGVVGPADLAALIGAWGADGGLADLDVDGNVGPADLAALIGVWGPCD
jgi:hypothetical protein